MDYSEGLEAKGMKATKKSYGNTVFGSCSKSSYFDTDKKRTKAIPGPGSYRVQSDFGMYHPGDIDGYTQENFF